MVGRGRQPRGTAVVGAALVLAAGAAALRTGPDGVGVPQELLDLPGAPAVLPVTAPGGYRYDSSTSTTSASGTAQSRTVLLRPERLEDEPTVSLCVDLSPERSSCPPAAGSIERRVDGVPVRITLRGPGGRAADELWRSLELTTDPARSGLFA